MWKNDEVDEYLEPDYEPIRHSLPYRIIPISGDKDCVQIITGKFKGISVLFDKVQFKENDDGLVLKFDHTVYENKEDIETDGDDFIQQIGDILVHLIKISHMQ